MKSEKVSVGTGVLDGPKINEFPHTNNQPVIPPFRMKYSGFIQLFSLVTAGRSGGLSLQKEYEKSQRFFANRWLLLSFVCSSVYSSSCSISSTGSLGVSLAARAFCINSSAAASSLWVTRRVEEGIPHLRLRLAKVKVPSGRTTVSSA